TSAPRVPSPPTPALRPPASETNSSSIRPAFLRYSLSAFSPDGKADFEPREAPFVKTSTARLEVSTFKEPGPASTRARSGRAVDMGETPALARTFDLGSLIASLFITWQWRLFGSHQQIRVTGRSSAKRAIS